MRAALDQTVADPSVRAALRQLFEHSSAYVTGAEEDAPLPDHAELRERWSEQRALDAAAALPHNVLSLAPRFRSRPSIFTGLLARMTQSGRPDLVAFVLDSIARDPSLTATRFGGRSLLHYAAGAGRLEIVTALLRYGAAPDMLDAGNHTPLYRVANECASSAGTEIVRALAAAGADVNAGAGVTRSTPLHMAARRGHAGIARALLELGADTTVRDVKGATPLQRAINCRKTEVAALLRR
jgi:hypothetical protein